MIVGKQKAKSNIKNTHSLRVVWFYTCYANKIFENYYMWLIFSKSVGYRDLWKASNPRLKWENPFLVTFDIFALMIRKTINKYIV